MKRILIVGGANGIGLSMAKMLASRDTVERVYIVDKAPLAEEYQESKIESIQFDLTSDDYTLFDRFVDVDGLIITAGFGRLALFEDIDEKMIPLYFNVNTVAVIRVIRHFYDRLLSNDDFYCGVRFHVLAFLLALWSHKGCFEGFHRECQCRTGEGWFWQSHSECLSWFH